MTNDNKINDVLGNILNETETKNFDLRQKERELWEESVELKYEKLKQKKEEEEHVKSIDLSVTSREVHIKKAQQDNDEYLTQAQQSMVFINSDFKNAIPFFGKNIILPTARTGDGKSTAVANISCQCLKQNKRVLVLTNEEQVADVYNRVCCLLNNWAYLNHDQFTTEQKDTFNKYMEILSSRMMVVDDNYCGATGQTTTLEGVVSLLESLITKGTKFDVIIIDYYQNIERSIKNPYLDMYQVQAQLASYLDGFKNRYLAPIVVFAQLKTESDKKMSFKEALEGRKVILNKATCAIRIIADRENQRTEWQIMKSRFSSAVGTSIFTGFDKGKYVPYTSEFKNRIELKKAELESRALLSKTFKKKSDEEK